DSEFFYNCTSHGFQSDSGGDATMFNFGISNCGGRGILLTNTSKLSLVSFTIDSNTSHGIECVSGCDSISVSTGAVIDNGGDGIKLTATSDKNIISVVECSDNGGYGVNIAASTCDNNIITGNAFEGNGSGAVHDLGTDTVIGMNVGDGSSVITEKYGADAGSNDTYAITTKPVTRAYAIGQKFLFRANTANTGAATLNVDGLGAITIKKKSATDLANNDILAGQLVEVAYNAADTTNVTLDSYSEANKDNSYALRSSAGSARGVAQTFDVGATTSILTSAKFHLAKVGSPTGNAVAKIYALTGSSGTTGKPTGTALAVSNNFDVSTL
ncbi:MAG: right-handed parallel beta-helix repeat-containing protein, partial [Patescibacteria group bacterium]